MATNQDNTYIGLDVGEKRIGVARIHSVVKIPEPLDLINVTEVQDVTDVIKKLVLDYNADGIVIGLPRGLDGQETAQTTICRQFALELSSNIDTPVYLIDEAGTSKLADERLGKNSQTSRDSMAAAILLDDFINYKNIDLLKV
jgi:putative Holliday junction resolvase